MNGIRSLAVALFIGAVFLSGCGNEEDGSCYVWPYQNLPDPNLENIWPNEDGTSWSFEYAYRQWDWGGFRLYPDPDSVPPLPSLDEFASFLACHEIGPNPQATRGTYRLEFDGDITTESGVTAQNLTETLEARGSDVSPTPARPQLPSFLARLAIARPDLRDRVLGLVGSRQEGLLLVDPGVRHGTSGRNASPTADESCLLDAAREPMFIHGYAWRKTEEWIGTFGDVDTLLAWKFLESNLEPCHEFTHQLVPGLADDVFLHCRILRQVVFRTKAGVFNNATECLYVLDYGIWEETDFTGTPVGWSRNVDCGIVVYAPTIGPLYDYERIWPIVGEPGDPGFGDVTVSLTSWTKIEH
jgi:hypothetical protein